MDKKREIHLPIPVDNKKRLEIKEIMNYFADNTYNYQCTDKIVVKASAKCQALWEKDYQIHVFKNELCTHYPAKIFIPLDVKNKSLGTPIDVEQMKNLAEKAHIARCRRRFPVPVILFNGNYVCRSSTTASNVEALGRLTADLLMGTDYSDHASDSLLANIMNTWNWTVSEKEFGTVTKIREADADLLRHFKVKSIIDLMVEFQKIKYQLPVSTSEKDLEKAGSSLHKDFDIYSTPYPGCEFFKQLRLNHYQLKDELYFNWSDPANDAKLTLPKNGMDFLDMGIEWSDYKEWSLVHMTQNYIKLILNLLEKGTNGILVHCISGWDRTPLFIAILRLSLWADGLIHTSLDSHDMVYLTVVYDWLLFGHHWTDRQAKGEDIFFFCYAVLTYLTTEDFSIQHMQKKREEKKMAATESINRNQHMYTSGSLLGTSEDNANGNYQLSVPLVSISEEHNNQRDDNEEVQRLSLSPNGKISPRKSTGQTKAAQRNRCVSGDSDGSFAFVNDAGSYLGTPSELDLSISDTAGNEPTQRSQRLYEVRSIFSAIWFGAMGQDGKLVEYGPQAGQQGYIRTVTDVASKFGRVVTSTAAAAFSEMKSMSQ